MTIEVFTTKSQNNKTLEFIYTPKHLIKLILHYWRTIIKSREKERYKINIKHSLKLFPLDL